jgi:hypothetical protein
LKNEEMPTGSRGERFSRAAGERFSRAAQNRKKKQFVQIQSNFKLRGNHPLGKLSRRNGKIGSAASSRLEAKKQFTRKLAKSILQERFTTILEKLKKKIRIIIEQDVSSVEYTGGGILGPMMIIKREKIKTWNRENNEDTRLRNHSKRRFEVR